jgi:putative N6-adenine-specific DNA methylase
LLYRANLCLRTAVRVLQPILNAPVYNEHELYDAVRTIDWSQLLTPDQTLAVDCNVRDSNLTHSLYAAQKTKDAICDQFVDRMGRRPSVDRERPHVGLNLHIGKNQAVLSLDSSGDSLHKRGYRDKMARAPLNEALAAGLILQTGWGPGEPLIDPLCGMGTLPIEAAWIALNRPPGLTRQHFGFMGWLDFDRGMFADLREQARRAVRGRLSDAIVGSDTRRDAVDFAADCARAAGVYHTIRFQVADLVQFRPPPGPPGVLICNPPYGERLGEVRELVGLYRLLGRVFRERCGGWRCFVFTSNEELAQAVDLPTVSAVPFFNGKIPCRLYGYAP